MRAIISKKGKGATAPQKGATAIFLRDIMGETFSSLKNHLGNEMSEWNRLKRPSQNL